METKIITPHYLNKLTKTMDPELARLPVIQYSTSSSDLSGDHLSQSSTPSVLLSINTRGISRREILAWLLISIQGFALVVSLQQNASDRIASVISSDRENKIHTPLSINGKLPSYHEKAFMDASSHKTFMTPFFDPPTHYPTDAGLVSRVWHSNGSPIFNDQLQKGSCWCSGDDYCMCTPSLAIDMILTSGPDHIWMVQRKVTGLMALMGGFNEIGETVEEAARRELKEEMNLDLPNQKMSLFGVYSDPKRDQRKHTVSVVFVMNIPVESIPDPGDDVLHVHRVSLDTIEGLHMFIDHKTIVRDYIKNSKLQTKKDGASLPKILSVDGVEQFKRSICSIP